MEAKELYFSQPPLTRYYLTIIFIISFMITYMKHVVFPSYLILDYTLIFQKYQIWRLFTNLFVIGQFSMGFLFF